MTLLYILLILMILYFTVLKSKRSLHMLQQNLYNENNRYGRWITRNYKETISLDWLGMFLCATGAFVTYDLKRFNLAFLAGLIVFYLLCAFLFKRKMSHFKQKKPLVVTGRIKRLITTTSIIYLALILIFWLWFQDPQSMWVLLFILSIFASFNFLLFYIINYINYPIERMVYHYYEKKAKNKLEDMPNLKIIGITGSYGKTSSKNILSDILNIKYIARPTPKNLNTYYGLMITINNHLDKFDEFFIAEMGAYVKGEIKGLCELVHPKYGILTRIGTAHLETFGSEKNIQEGKFELIESLPLDGIGVLNRDDPKQVSYHLKNKCRIIWIGIDSEDADVRATDIKCSSAGTTFNVHFKGDKKSYLFETRLLGKHNVYNILASLALGKEFGIDIKMLQKGVKNVRAVEHRLELKRIGSFYQIDDAYNSNPVGAANALEVLSLMPGKKIVVTPGMIELGDKEQELNQEFGREIAKVADLVILIGKKRTKPIQDGLKLEDYNEDRIVIFNDVREAYPYIQSLNTNGEEIYALFENDLPDSYDEN